MPGEERILVTGAGGFIGGWLAETLFLNDPTSVRAGVHSWMGAVRPARFPVEIVLCDLLNPQQVSDAVNGMSCVIHCAKGPSEESITQGTKNMLEAALHHGVKRFVYISTTEIYGNLNGIVNEAMPYQTTGALYGDSKIYAEKMCWDYCSRGLPVTVVRPSIVYGPFSKNWTVDICQKLQSGNWGIFKGQGEGICNLIYISDLVAGILMTVQNDHAIGEAFNLNGPETLTWNEYFRRFNAVMNLSELKVIGSNTAILRSFILEPLRSVAKYAKKNFEIPIRKISGRVKPAKQTLKYIEKTLKTSPRRTDYSLYNRKAFYTHEKAVEVLGYKPAYNLERGLELTVLWLKQIGLVNS